MRFHSSPHALLAPQRLWLLLVLFALVCPHVTQAVDRPNFVFILADDLGWSDTSTGRTNLGNPSSYYETPAIDRLAREGTVFSNAYTAGANCAPTRAALLTGLYAARSTNNVFGVDHLNRGGRHSLLIGPPQGLPSGADAIPRDAVTYSERLRELGYRTAHCGKFHVTEDDPDAIIEHHGFEENHGGSSSGSPRRYHAKGGVFGAGVGPEVDRFASDYTTRYIDRNVLPFSKGATESILRGLEGSAKHLSDGLTDAAIDFLRRCGDSPFLLQFNAYAVHTPVGDPHARSDLLKKYRAKPGQGTHARPSFAALIEGLDQSVARLIRYLEETPDPRSHDKSLAESTLVLFCSDNGGRLPHSNNGPLRGQKGELYEGGIRVPLIAWSGDPELAAQGATVSTPVTSVDFYPTLVGLAGGVVSSGESDGVDLAPLFSQRQVGLERDAIFWHFPGYLDDRDRTQRPQSVIRSGPWKLIYSYEGQSYELYNLETDLSESDNLIAKRPETAAKLSRRLADWLHETRAPLATLREGEMAITAHGGYYQGSKVHAGNTALRVRSGEEVPFVILAQSP